MTVVNVETLGRKLVAADGIPATATLTYWAGYYPAVEVEDENIIFPTPITVTFSAGVPTATVDLEPSVRACVQWRFNVPGVSEWTVYTMIPENGPVDFEDLPVVDPHTLVPSDDAQAAWDATLAQVQELLSQVDALVDEAAFWADESESSAGDSATSATESATSATAAANSAAASATSAGQAAGSAAAAAGSAGAASDSATAAAGSATDAANSAATAAATNWGGTNIATGTNLDTVLQPGRYYFSSSTPDLAMNYPFASGSGLMEVLKYSGTTQAVVQRITYTSGTMGAQGMFTRRWLNSWGGWVYTPSLRVNNPGDQPGRTFSFLDGVGGGTEFTVPITGISLGTADLNTVTLPGIYIQTSSSNSTLARNYPVASYGVLEVVAMSTSIQQKYTQSGNSGMRGTYMRNRNTNGVDWGAWVLVPAVRVNNPTDQPGAEYYMWNGSTEQQVQPIAIGFSGTSQSLDAITVGGSYYNTTTTIATLANGWPIAGVIATLEVIPGSSGGNCIQRLTPFGGNQLVRGQYVRRRASGVWDPWRFIPTQYVDQTAGRTISTWDDLNNRAQVIYGDTGARDISDLFLASAGVTGGATGGNVYLSRVGGIVTLTFVALVLGSTTAFSGVIPSGFRPATSEYTGCPGLASNKYIQVTTAGTVSFISGAAGDTERSTITFRAAGSWPTALPGTAVGSIPA